MERYHIFKLGLAITFYAAYCIRPMLVYSLNTDNNLDNNKNVLNPEHEYFQYFQGVEGRPGRDFPVYSYIPKTTFSCRGIESGYYADLDTDCQVFHICEEGKKISFLCPNGTIFQQSELICEWWNKVNCTNSPNLYEESAERLQNEVARRKSLRRVAPLNGAEMEHGAVMRIEERTSVRAMKNGKEYPVRQQTQRTQRIKNHRIPDNNDIEQQIEEAESNNRHLANAQNTIASSQKDNYNDQNQKNPNHNYAANDNPFNIDNGATPLSINKQTKKDIDKQTSNFLNNNNEPASIRHSKRLEQSERNNHNLGTKTVQPKTTTLKEYHVEFGSTSSGIDSSTTSYNSPDGSSFSSRETFEPGRIKYSNGYNDKNTEVPSSDLTKSNKPLTQTRISKTTETNFPSYNANNEHVFKGSSRNGYSNTLTSSLPSQGPTANGKVSRGSVRYTNPNYLNNQGTEDDHIKNQAKTLSVTTYSPPVKYSSVKIVQNTRISNLQSSAQDNYNLPFPKHKSEVASDQSSFGVGQSGKNNFNFVSRSSTIRPNPADTFASSTQTPSRIEETSFNGNGENEGDQNLRGQESDETQVTQESSSFVKSSFNSIADNSFKTSVSPYPNHRSTYSDIKDISYLEAPKLQSISSITAHLVTTQPINNGKPFVGSRVGTTLIPNQPTTPSKYTYLPTTTSSKPSVIFGVIRHSSTTQPPPYGPPEMFNLGTDYPISERFNVGNTDKTRPTVETTTLVTNPVPTESFNVGSTESTIKPNILPVYGISTIKPLDISVPEHGSLNVGQNDQPLEPIKKDQVTLRPGSKAVSDRFNSYNIDETYQTGDISSNKVTTLYSGIINIPTSERFNIGNIDKTRPTIETTTYVTNSLPQEPFNIGNTDNSLSPNVSPTLGTTTDTPLEIYVPDQGSLNLGQGDVNINDGYNGLEPVNEPPFIKKHVPLLFSNGNTPISTIRSVDHATVYGTYASTTQRSPSSSNNTPYSPTVPTVTQSYLQSSSPAYESTSSSRIPKGFNRGVPIQFANGQDKISIQLSRNLGGQVEINQHPRYKSSQQPVRKINAVVRVGDVRQFGSSSSTAAPYTQQNGLYSNEGFSKQAPSSFSVAPKSKTERPRPFARTLEEQLNAGDTSKGPNKIGTTFPAYQISSARPFGLSQATPSTPYTTTDSPPSFSIYNNVDSMMNVLQEIGNYNTPNDFFRESRPGLIIPPSVGPQTLHSLAQYFANELQRTDPKKEGLTPETKEKLTSLLTAMTVHGYNNLFTVESTETTTTSTSDVSYDNITVDGTATRVGSEDGEENNSVSGQGENTMKDDNASSDDDLLTTTSLPELRQLARNFSLALSSYLHDPENFKKSLEGLRPTEPPPLDGNDNVESSTTEDELLNFSDADVKPSTPAVPSATWGYIVAPDSKNGIQDDVKNSLNPDLNTADSQSFIPSFNNLQVDDKLQKGFTELPPNHWTSSPQATKLWQKALSVNPAVVNEQFETTPSLIRSEVEEETNEAELFNQEVLPDLSEPHSQISYELRELPPLSLNSTQIHGILIDFMNYSKSDEHNRLNRILKKLNTSEEEFLDRMKEIESNPLTKRLVLLLISECGANITQDLEVKQLTQHVPHHGSLRQSQGTLSALESSASLTTKHTDTKNRENHNLGQLVHHKLSEDDQDARALQLLNSLYTIASRFGRKR